MIISLVDWPACLIDPSAGEGVQVYHGVFAVPESMSGREVHFPTYVVHCTPHHRMLVPAASSWGPTYTTSLPLPSRYDVRAFLATITTAEAENCAGTSLGGLPLLVTLPKALIVLRRRGLGTGRVFVLDYTDAEALRVLAEGSSWVPRGPGVVMSALIPESAFGPLDDRLGVPDPHETGVVIGSRLTSLFPPPRPSPPGVPGVPLGRLESVAGAEERPTPTPAPVPIPVPPAPGLWDRLLRDGD